jgi:hypothetical protein
MSAVIEVKYFNSFLLKKTLQQQSGGDITPVWNGSFGVPQELGGYPRYTNYPIDGNWSIEEARIRGGYNNTSVDYGVKAYLVEDDPNSSIRGNSLIYSGVFNSRTSVNDTNVFSIGEEITKSADPANGSIQKLYAEDTNLIIFQQSKVSRALIDKDAIYSAEGSGSITNVNTTIGTIIPYAGNFGISSNPESFATYGYRKYFTDKDRNAVLRLSMDGLTDISKYGMSDYFRDEFKKIDSGSLQGVLIGGWDIYNKQYVLSSQTKFNSAIDNYETLSFDEDVKGWTSFFTYKPDQIVSLKSKFYSLKNGELFRHYDSNSNRNVFYGESFKSSITFVFNPKVSLSKVFKTISYEGSNGWEVTDFTSDETGTDVFTGLWSSSSDTANSSVVNRPAVYSYNEGYYLENGVPQRAGFNRKENKYHANIVNHSVARQEEVLWGNSMSGIKGFYCTVKVSTDNTTDVGGAKELFAVSSNYSESSY